MERLREKSTPVYIDLYDQVVNGCLVDVSFANEITYGQVQEEDPENRIFNLKVRGYFNED
jgi:hypothetical protein